MSHLLGIDLGTSSVKAVLVKVDGHIDGLGSAEYAIHQWADARHCLDR